MYPVGGGGRTMERTCLVANVSPMLAVDVLVAGMVVVVLALVLGRVAWVLHDREQEGAITAAQARANAAPLTSAIRRSEGRERPDV
jgi:hypothetical protein